VETISSDRAELTGAGVDLVALYCLRREDRVHPCELRFEDMRTGEHEVRLLKHYLDGPQLGSLLGICAELYKTRRVFFKICTGAVPDLTPEIRQGLLDGTMDPQVIYNDNGG
jgi:hypothetical protein